MNWKIQDQRWEEMKAFMDEFRIARYREDGSLDF